MIEKIKKIWSYCAPYLYLTLILACAYGYFSAIAEGPSMYESEKILLMMKSDMDVLKEQGIRVTTDIEKAKFGGAILYVSFHNEGTYSDFSKKYGEILLLKNWKKVHESPNKFCKDGVLTKLNENAGVSDGYLYSSIIMEFNSSTKKRCS